MSETRERAPARTGLKAAADESRPELKWWGSVDMPSGGVVRVVAGPTRVWVERRSNDWRVFSAGSDWPDERDACPAERPHEAAAEELEERVPDVRFCFADAPTRLVVSVAQADRPFVVRPETRLSVGPGERVTLYVSTPTWMVLSVERVARKRPGTRHKAEERSEPQRLTELPLERPSDTWFGRNTVAGELCYATRTAGYLRLDEVPRLPHLAITPVTIENKAADPLEFERVQVPVPLLGVYADATGALWTNALSLTRETSGDLAAVKVESGVPTAARGASERLAKPRSEGSKSSVVRAFSRLLQIGANTP